MHIGRSRRHRSQLRRLFRLRLNLSDLLPLHRRRRYLCTKNDVADLRLRQGRDVHVVLFAIVGKDQILEGDLNTAPLVVGQCWPHMMRLCDGRLIGLQDHLGTVVVHVECAKNENEARKCRVRRNGAKPIIVKIEQQHLRFGGLEDNVAELLDLQRCLERQLQVRPLDHNVWEVQQVHLERVQHSLARDNDLLWLLLDRKRPNQRRNLLSSFPLGKLTQALLSSPDGGVDNLQEQLARARVEDEYGTIDGLRREISLKSLVNRNAIHIRVIHEPDNLVREEFAVVLR
mmetsp:Transcript_71215/g.190132  ORF Transcript_71215/g.190132 Transcript_71215/m.190132 type:complete len:287 (+) Transcript_71215:956-1816(+)